MINKIEVRQINAADELTEIENEIYHHVRILDTRIALVFLEIDYDNNARLYISDGALNEVIVKIPIKAIKENRDLKIYLARYYDNSEDWLNITEKL